MLLYPLSNSDLHPAIYIQGQTIGGFVFWSPPQQKFIRPPLLHPALHPWKCIFKGEGASNLAPWFQSPVSIHQVLLANGSLLAGRGTLLHLAILDDELGVCERILASPEFNGATAEGPGVPTAYEQRHFLCEQGKNRDAPLFCLNATKRDTPL